TAQRARQPRQQATGGAARPAGVGGELPGVSRLDQPDGLRPPGPGPGLRAAGPRRAVRGGGGRRLGRGDEPAMNSDLIHKIVALSQGGASMRRIARSLGVSRRTVSKALEEIERARGLGPPEGAPRPRTARGRLLDAYEPAIADLLARYPGITAQRV